MVTINQSRHFSLDEAKDLLPIIKGITRKSLEEFLRLEEELQHCRSNSQSWHDVESQIVHVLNRWSHKILQLGCYPKGIWLVDFDNGEGYYCWRYGDEDIQYFHGYKEGFNGRITVN